MRRGASAACSASERRVATAQGTSRSTGGRIPGKSVTRRCAEKAILSGGHRGGGRASDPGACTAARRIGFVRRQDVRARSRAAGGRQVAGHGRVSRGGERVATGSRGRLGSFRQPRSRPTWRPGGPRVKPVATTTCAAVGFVSPFGPGAARSGAPTPGARPCRAGSGDRTAWYTTPRGRATTRPVLAVRGGRLLGRDVSSACSAIVCGRWVRFANSARVARARYPDPVGLDPAQRHGFGVPDRVASAVRGASVEQRCPGGSQRRSARWW